MKFGLDSNFSHSPMIHFDALFDIFYFDLCNTNYKNYTSDANISMACFTLRIKGRAHTPRRYVG